MRFRSENTVFKFLPSMVWTERIKLQCIALLSARLSRDILWNKKNRSKMSQASGKLLECHPYLFIFEKCSDKRHVRRSVGNI